MRDPALCFEIHRRGGMTDEQYAAFWPSKKLPLGRVGDAEEFRS